MTAQLDASKPPAPLPVPEEGAKALLERAQVLFPSPVKGKAQEVDPHLVEVREYAKWAIEYWKDQVDAANAQIQCQMGDAQRATVNGIPVLTRVKGNVKGHWVDDFDRDYLMSAGK